MKTQIPERLSALREAMKKQNISAYIIPTTDPHMSEYPAACWKYREWISGFTGSAGTVVVTLERQACGPTHGISCKPKLNWKAVVLTCIG